MTTQPVDIFVFGRTFRVNCPAEQKAALELAAMDLDNRLTELKNRTRVTNVEQLVFIAALNVCHELAQERNKTAEFAHNMEERIRLLQNTIEQALLENTSIDLTQSNRHSSHNSTHNTVHNTADIESQNVLGDNVIASEHEAENQHVVALDTVHQEYDVSAPQHETKQP